MKKLTILVAALIVLFSGCTDKNATEVSAPAPAEGAASLGTEKDSVSLVFNPQAPLNPLETNNRTNTDLLPLIYDSLYTLDRNLRPTPLIASGMTSEDNINFTLTIRTDVFLHSGRQLTSADVKYTIDSLRTKNDSIYYERVKNIVSCEVKSENSLAIILSAPNGLLASLLDFPIVPEGIEGGKPDGTGRYKYQTTSSGAELSANESHILHETMKVKKIKLIPAQDTGAMATAFNTGTVDLLRLVREESATFDLKNEKQVASLINNNLIYIGVNVYRAGLSDSRVRNAISAFADRVKLSEGYNGNRLYIAYTALSPLWYLSDSSSSEQNDLKQAEMLLNDAGYSILDGNGIRHNARGSKLSFNLIVNEDNFERVSLAEKLADNLKQAGVDIKVSQQPLASYKAAVGGGGFDLYIGEVKLSSDMDISPLCGSGGSLNYGGYSSSVVDSAFTKLKSVRSDDERKTAAAELKQALAADMPVIPLFFTTSAIVTHAEVELSVSPTVSNIWNGIWMGAQQ